MKIILVHNYYMSKGGEDRTFALEADLLRRNGHAVLEYTDTNLRVKNLSGINAAIQTIWSEYSKRRLLKLLKQFKPDIAHFHNTFLLISPSAYYACMETGVPVVQTLHNYRLFCPSAIFFRDGNLCEDCIGKTFPWPGIWHACFYNSRNKTAVVAAMLTVHRFLKTWNNQVNAYIAPTDFFRRKLIKCGLPEDRIFIKPNFIYPDPGINNEAGCYALFVGRISSEKGVRTIIEAWRRINSIPLRIVGEGPLSAKFKQYVNRMNIKNLEFLDSKSKEEVLLLMKMAKFLIIPSEWYECLPTVIVEAFSCGVPVITSRLGAMAEIVEDKKTGLLFAPGDSEDLADKVQWAWNHPEEMKSMGKEARKEYEAKYTAEKNYQILMDIYQKAEDFV